MQTSNFWDKLYLRGSKALVVLFLLTLAYAASGQGWANVNNPRYDDRKINYGFLIGVHNTTFKMKYSDEFLSNELDSVHSVLPRWSPGFSLGFIVNYKLGEFFDIRILPKVAFYEHMMEYNYTDESQASKLKESTIVEFPLLLKYKSDRRGNIRMYTVAGLKPGIETSKNELESGIETLNLKRTNLSVELGFGFDLYFPLFKFSPELRFSRGMINMLGDQPSIYSAGIGRLNTNTIHLYLLFQ